MKHNTQAFLNEQFVFEKEVFIAWLGPADLLDSKLEWHHSCDGELFLLRKVGAKGYTFSERHNKRPTKLGSFAELKTYIQKTSVQVSQSEDVFDSLLRASDAICLSLYPGFIREDDSSNELKCLFYELYEAIEKNNPDSGGKLLVKCIQLISSSSRQASMYIRHCLQYLPNHSVGLLCANGLIGRNYWRSRHQEALIEGWRFQLLNPGQKYYSQVFDSDNASSVSLIERDICLEDRTALLTSTGLTENDVVVATETAELAPAEDAGLRTKILLRLLNHRSNLRNADTGTTDIEFPASLID